MEEFREDLQLLSSCAQIDWQAAQKQLYSWGTVIFNPASSEVALRAVFDSVVHFLERDSSPLLPHAVKLLADLVVLHPTFFPSPSVVSALQPILSSGKRIAAAALSALVSVAQSGGDGWLAVRSALSEDLILFLANSRPVAVRTQLLRLLAIDFHLGHEIISEDSRLLVSLRVFFGLTADLYPSVRSAALNGLQVLCENEVARMDVSAMQNCYDAGVELLREDDVFVKMSAIRLASALGQMLVATKQETEKIKFSDAQFLKLCSLARDMDMRIRVEVFLSLENIKLVSETVLLQSLTKKVKKIDGGRKSLAEFTEKGCDLPISWAAGVFLQGLEDEFHEVRRAACLSMGALTRLSAKFAGSSLDLLMDMLNDDCEAVQLQTLQTLLQMAKNGDMKVQERHMHMFLGTLANSSAPIRRGAREVIKLTRLPNMELFRLSINELLRNLEAYGQDEEDILAALFCVGKAHGRFASRITQEHSPEMEFKLDSPRVVALLVLGISPSFSNEEPTQTVPARIFSYSIPLFGRISPSLKEFISKDALLSFLCQRAGFPFLEEAKFQAGGSETELTVSAVNRMLKRASQAWLMIKVHSSVAVETLRACRKELEMVDQSSSEASAALLVFSLEYIQVLQLVAEVWEQMEPKGPHIIRIRKLDALLEKLEINLRGLQFLSLGLTEKEESHLLELSLLQFALRLSTVGSQESPPIMSKMRFLLSRLEQLASERKSDLSAFVRQSRSISWSTPIVDFPDLRTLEQVGPGEGLRRRKAELRARSVDPELPLMFVPGLPVGIPIEITLRYVSGTDRVWLRMAGGESTQYAFLSFDRFDGPEGNRRLAVDVPFYATPTVPFLLRAVVCMECSSAWLTRSQSQRGPRRETVDLSKEVEIYLADVDNKGLR